MKTGSRRPGKLNTIVYVLFGIQILFSHLSNGFYNFIAYIDNHQDSSGIMVGLISIVAMLAAAAGVVWSGRRHSLVLMFLSAEMVYILHRVFIHPLQILRPSNLLYSVVVIALTVLFVMKLPPEKRRSIRLEPQPEAEADVQLTEDSGPPHPVTGTDKQVSGTAAAKFGMILLYILAAVPVLYSIYSKYGDYSSMLTFGKYLKLSYFFVLLNVIYLFIPNTYLRAQLKVILTLIMVYTLSIFVLPLFFYFPFINNLALYVWYYKGYALLAVLITASLYTLLLGKRVSLLARLSERIYI